jgi:hypothetical protein
MKFFHQVPKKKIFFFNLVKKKIALIFIVIGACRFFADFGGFFDEFFVRFFEKTFFFYFCLKISLVLFLAVLVNFH